MISPQIDLMIVDTLVPHKIFQYAGPFESEIVPLEAVVGVFEIKRTLTDGEKIKAFKHLLKIQKSIGDLETQYPKNLMHVTGIYQKNIYWLEKPMNKILRRIMYGIIAISHSKLKDNREYFDKFWQQYQKMDQKPFIDSIGTFDGIFLAVENKQERKQNQHAVCLSYINKKEVHHFLRPPDNIRGVIGNISAFLGYVLAYIQYTEGIPLNVNNYFFNKSKKIFEGSV